MATEYNIARTAGQCVKCNKELLEKEEFVAVLTESGEQFQRVDWCRPCWEAPDRGEVANLFSVWHSHMPVKEIKKRLFIDDAMLVNFFQRLDGAEEPARVNFRFVLALVLMRKRLLMYDRAVTDNGVEKWAMKLRGTDEMHQVINPKLDESRIAEVSEQLSQILQGEL